MAREKNVNQIYRFDGKGVLMEIMSSGFSIEKVIVNIATYDTNNKQIALNPYYFDFAEWFSISNMVTSGIWLNKAYHLTQAAAQNNSYVSDIYTDMSGTAREKLKTKRPSGADESRVFRVYPSAKKADYLIFSIAVGDGQKKDKGIIAPKFNAYLNKSEGSTIINKIMINYDELRGVCRLVDSRIQAFIISQQLAGAYNYVPPAPQVEPQNSNVIPLTPYEQPSNYAYNIPPAQNPNIIPITPCEQPSSYAYNTPPANNNYIYKM